MFPPRSPRYAICRLTDLSWNGDGKGDLRFVWHHRMVIAFLVSGNVAMTFLPIIMARSTASEVALVLIFAPTAVNVFMT